MKNMSDFTRRTEADELRENLSKCHDYIAELEAENTPIEVVGELIRCKDCRWYIESDVFKGKDCTHFSGLKHPNPDDYCSYCERKEE